MKNKRGMEAKSVIVGIIVLLILMTLVLVIIFMTKSKGTNAIEYIKNLFRFGSGVS